VFDFARGIEVFPAEDQLRVLDAWSRRDEARISCLDAHLLADRERTVTLHMFDLREQHHVHVVVLEGGDADLVRRSVAQSALPRRIAHTTRDAMAVFLAADEATTDLLGWAVEDLVGRRTVDLVHPDDVERAIEAWLGLRVQGGTSRQRVRYRHADGHYVWLEVTNQSELDDSSTGVVRSELVDISAEMAHLEDLQERERQLARLAEALPIGIAHLRPDGEALYANEPYRSLIGPTASQDALLGAVAEPDRPRVLGLLERAFAGVAGEIEVSVHRNGRERRCELTLRPLPADGPAGGAADGAAGDGAQDGAQDGVIACVSDVTDRSRLRAQLEHQATHDALSGCLNRGAAVLALEQSLRTSPRVAVAFIDLDGFKAINDTLGHAAGDELLRTVASRLRAVTRGEDRLGRLGGDEFVVICPGGEEPVDEEELSRRLTDVVNGDMGFAGRRIAFRASVGVAVSEPGEVDAEAVLTRADVAMYRVKRGAATAAALAVH
jgi:diguanylate cyclase (GGDEF)-like protein/PAS domain S-box-containing protein